MTSTAINTLNGLFYSSYAGDIYTTGLAQLYSHNPEIFAAFADLFHQLYPRQQALKVKHLSAGSRADFVWQQISLHSTTQFNIEVSDIVAPSLSKKNVQNCQLSTTAFDLRQSFPEISTANRFDLIFATYSFDSIWFEQDAYYLKEGNHWFQVHYQLQLKKSDSIPSYISDFLSAILNTGISTTRLPQDYFDALEITETRTQIDIASKPYGKQIKSYYQDFERAQCAFPGGMIQRVKEAFANQLATHGAIILGEVIIPDHTTMTTLLNRNLGHQRSGKIARYKIEDYGLAAQILRAEGFNFRFIPIKDFVKKHTPNAKLHQYQQISDTNHIVIIQK